MPDEFRESAKICTVAIDMLRRYVEASLIHACGLTDFCFYHAYNLQGSWTQLARSGRLLELDLTYVEGLTPYPDVWNVAAHVLLQYDRDHQVKMISDDEAAS